MTSSQQNPWLHRIALLTCIATFPLIFMGGLVTSKHAGMSVPDWPNSYGYNMFLFPPRLWDGGIFYEHTHRLMGTVVGFCAIMLASVAWGPSRLSRGRRWIARITIALESLNAIGTGAMVAFPNAFHLPPTMQSAGAIVPQGAVTAVGILLVAIVAWFSRTPEPRRWVRWLTLITLLAVCIQGLLGGLRVDLINLTLAIIHGCFAQAFFCLTVFVAVVTSSSWTMVARTDETPVSRERSLCHGRPACSLCFISLAALLLVYFQLIIGAIMRHQGAGLAIPDVPLNYGHLLPPTTSDALATINAQRAWQYHLDPVALPQIWLHFGHRVGAAIVTFAAIALIAMIVSRHRREAGLLRPAIVLAVLLALQITLGILTVLLRKPADVASTHVAVGALVLVTTFVIAIRVARLCYLKTAAVLEISQRRQNAILSSMVTA